MLAKMTQKMTNKPEENAISCNYELLPTFSTFDKTNTQLQAHGKIYKEWQIPPITFSNVEIHLNIKQILQQKTQQASQ